MKKNKYVVLYPLGDADVDTHQYRICDNLKEVEEYIRDTTETEMGNDEFNSNDFEVYELGKKIDVEVTIEEEPVIDVRIGNEKHKRS